MRFAELVGRLNPKAQSYTLGSGGIPTMTTEDICGALADAERICGKDAVHIFLLRANPDMAKRYSAPNPDEMAEDEKPDEKHDERSPWGVGLEVLLRKMIAKEFKARYAPARDLDCEIECASLIGGSPEAVQKLIKKRAALVKSLWPGGRNERYTNLIGAVLKEWTGCTLCKVCNGRKEVWIESQKHTCTACGGSGVEQITPERRAAAMGVSRTSYIKSWSDVYGWLIGQLVANSLRVERAGKDALYYEEAA